ncbi:MAG: aquaporin [candidate division Zixibacteria bacterium]|nr:aquaporin [candidate division Zixibacteria bacterium]
MLIFMNPAKHLGPALFGGGLQHTWVNWLDTLIGGTLGPILISAIELNRCRVNCNRYVCQ